MPDWLQPLLRVSHFLHFFRDEMNIPSDLMKEIFDTMMENHLEGSMDNIIVIQKIPKTSETYNKKWIFERLFELLVKHQAIVLNEKQDV